MKWFRKQRLPDSFKRLSRSKRREMSKILRAYSARQRSTIVSLEKVLSARSLQQKEQAQQAFEVAADIVDALGKTTPVEHDGFLEKIRKERDFLLDQVFDAKQQRERADLAEKQLRGATEEIDELKLRLKELQDTGVDPLIAHLAKVPSDLPERR